MSRSLVLSSAFLVVAWAFLAPAGLAEPPAALVKAKTKFEQDVAKTEEALLAGLDKALTAATKSGNKALGERIGYERDMFTKFRIVPSTFNATVYAKQRNAACDALEAAYAPVVRDMRKAKKEDEASALDKELSELLRAARGYGMALPELEPKVAVLIENKQSGTVLEGKNGTRGERVLLAPKVGKKQLAQCWYIEREEKGVVFRNVANGGVLTVSASFNKEGEQHFWTEKLEADKETPERSLVILTEHKREVVLRFASSREGRALGVSDRKVKGVTTYDLATVELANPPDNLNLWIVTPAR